MVSADQIPHTHNLTVTVRPDETEIVIEKDPPAPQPPHEEPPLISGVLLTQWFKTIAEHWQQALEYGAKIDIILDDTTELKELIKKTMGTTQQALSLIQLIGAATDKQAAALAQESTSLNQIANNQTTLLQKIAQGGTVDQAVLDALLAQSGQMQTVSDSIAQQAQFAKQIASGIDNPVPIPAPPASPPAAPVADAPIAPVTLTQ